MNMRETMDFEWYTIFQVCAALENKRQVQLKERTCLKMPMASKRNRLLLRLRHWLVN